jgi:serine/threonine-protein kinase
VADDKRTRIGTPAPNAPVTPATTPAPAVTPAPAPPYTPPPDHLLGQILAGRYLIQKKLGEGGMGAVYLATHTVLEKQVALKVLHGEFARKPELVERFMQEAKAASRIRHENVIDISDFGSTPDGLVFFAMELLKGHDLHEEIARARLSGKRLPWEHTRPIFLQVCAALSAAHAQGIVHRDLKPENIYLVEWLGHKNFVKLLDFGIAKLTEVEGGDRKLTRTGMLFGTPEYMSPEQARGEHVDHRVDIYAMGCILYQMLTGRVPFEAENFMGILSLHLTELPAPIGAPLLDSIGAPHGLEAIVMRALAKNRDERYQTIDDMANAIRALHGEDAVPVQTPAVPVGTGRVKTQWTGQVTLPTEEDAEPRDRTRPAGGSKLPWIVAAVLIAGGAGAAAFVLTRGGGGGGGAARAAAVDAGVAAADAAPVASVPARVTLSLSSEPPGAEIFDLVTQKAIGPTPMEFEVEGSREARRYRLSLAGHVTKVIELVPDQDVEHTVTLKRGKAPATDEVEVVPPAGRKPPKTPPKDPPKDPVVKDPPKDPPKDPVVKDPPKDPPKDPDPDEPVIKNPFETKPE